MASNTTAVVLEGYVGLSMTFAAVWDVAMLGMVTATAAQFRMCAGVQFQLLSLRLVTLGAIRFELA